MTLNGNALTTAIATVAIGTASLFGIASASASPLETTTVDGIDYPVCMVEDCSDQPGQIGVWTSKNDGRSYLIIGEDQTYPITR